MRYRKTEIWKSVDWITILLYLIMVIAGWFSICGASYEFDNVGLFDPSGRPGMQMIWIGTSLALIFVILMLESDFFDIFAYLIYAGSPTFPSFHKPRYPVKPPHDRFHHKRFP